jgi:two-component system, chemotaxis family, chemotaxis protein CheY
MAKILVVDDSKFMRRIIIDTLESGGHEVVGQANNGIDGIASYKSYKPDLVTMDITMGGKDGIIAVKEILEFDSNAKVVVVSALNEQTLKNSDSNICASAYVTKPFDKGELLDIIKKILSS